VEEIAKQLLSGSELALALKAVIVLALGGLLTMYRKRNGATAVNNLCAIHVGEISEIKANQRHGDSRLSELTKSVSAIRSDLQELSEKHANHSGTVTARLDSLQSSNAVELRILEEIRERMK
jgi:hypothetical protein